MRRSAAGKGRGLAPNARLPPQCAYPFGKARLCRPGNVHELQSPHCPPNLARRPLDLWQPAAGRPDRCPGGRLVLPAWAGRRLGVVDERRAVVHDPCRHRRHRRWRRRRLYQVGKPVLSALLLLVLAAPTLLYALFLAMLLILQPNWQ